MVGHQESVSVFSMNRLKELKVLENLSGKNSNDMRSRNFGHHYSLLMLQYQFSLDKKGDSVRRRCRANSFWLEQRPRKAAQTLLGMRSVVSCSTSTSLLKSHLHWISLTSSMEKLLSFLGNGFPRLDGIFGEQEPLSTTKLQSLSFLHLRNRAVQKWPWTELKSVNSIPGATGDTNNGEWKIKTKRRWPSGIGEQTSEDF